MPKTIEARKTLDISQFLPPVPRVIPQSRRVKSPATQPTTGLKKGAGEKGKPGRKPAQANETPRDRAIRIGTRRVKTALTAIRRCGNLSSRYYAIPQQHVDLMFKTLRDALTEQENRFAVARTGENKVEKSFDFFNTVR